MELKTTQSYTCTDRDNNQYGRWLGGDLYEFIEFRNSKLYHELIDLTDYSDEEIEHYISGYYPSLENLKYIYGMDSDWIIAECIFEQQTGLY